ncbi:uncharacterized protein LOC106151027 [Lingula anatina]|uniref:Uncharacterized protein LOC106151027 n=1 Tax=Lingula anatina TaxID=7574 RepID=A0A1S3H0T2_LINAN|nr:uncharacterized protein LOC106151027 [Lingula anatina]|eukprot:XP_013379542.1 uncharacterized protein LOC106151027 [Lingula anatina]
MGVAKRATLVAVKVLSDDGSGSIANIGLGIEYAVNDAKRRNAKAVINMSLGGGASTAFDEMCNDAVREGVTMVVAAGNSGADACSESPARAADVISVAASDSRDDLASFSNHGRCVDIIAPGVGVLGARTKTNSGSVAYSGTSMAAPHVAGAVAVFLGNQSGNPTPAEVREWLETNASEGKINVPTASRPGASCCQTTTRNCNNKCPTVNKLLYVGC